MTFRPFALALCALALAASPFAARAQTETIDPNQIAVQVLNKTEPELCAERDNVDLEFVSPEVRRFRLQAVHPSYIGTIAVDRWAPDFTACDMSQDPSFSFVPRTLTLYEDTEIRLVGHRFQSFWRADVVDFRVGKTSERGLHLVQLLKRGPQRDVEILVVYPADGYWRVKPLPPPTLVDSAYGSSFLFGPIEEDTRPFVAIRSIAFDPVTMTFRLTFRNQTSGVLTVASATTARVNLALSLDPPLPAEQPFAALRSMFVAPAQADVAVAGWSGTSIATVSTPILEFSRFRAVAVRFGRIVQSTHNLSAPDLVFDGFNTATSR